MIWRKRKRTEARAERPTEENSRMITTSDDIDRAETAARVAALKLQAARDRRPEVDEKAKEMARLIEENGFAELIRNAFGS
jgi:hypothetical protein